MLGEGYVNATYYEHVRQIRVNVKKSWLCLLSRMW